MPAGGCRRLTFGTVRAVTLALSACLAPMAAAGDTAEQILTQVEDHCIQPGKPYQHFVATPGGWQKVSGSAVRTFFKMASLTVAPWVGIERGTATTPLSAMEADIKKNADTKLRYYIENYNNGHAAVFRHAASASVLVVETHGRWLYAECTFWPSPTNTDLQDLIMRRWTISVPNAKTSLAGDWRSMNFNIRRNGTPAELGVDVYRVAPDVGPVPLYLELVLLPN